MTEIQMAKPVKIILANCIFDEENPNEMSDEQETSLGKSMRKWDYIGDLIVVDPPDKNGKQLIHHGEHKVKELLKAGNKWAWGFIKKMNKLEHKAFRQTMNLLHGQHDPEKQRAELQYFAEKNKLDFLSELIAMPKEQLLIETETAPVVTEDPPMIDHHEDTFLNGMLKQFHFVFKNDEFEKIMKKVDIINKDFKTDNNTDMFTKLVDWYMKHRKKK